MSWPRLAQIDSNFIDPREFRRGVSAAGIFGLIIYLLWIVLANPFPLLWPSFLVALHHHVLQPAALFWAFNLWLSPLVGLLFFALAPAFRPALAPKQGALLSSPGQAGQIQAALALFVGMTSVPKSQALVRVEQLAA